MEQTTRSGMLESVDLSVIRPTDNGLKECDPDSQPPQDAKPLEIGPDGLPSGCEAV